MAAELLSYGNHQLSSIAWHRRFQASSRARLPVTQRLSGRFGVPRRHMRAQQWENAVSCPPQDNVWNAEESYSNLQVQTLRNFPKEQLHGKVVLVRFDSRILLNESQTSNSPTDKACFTINYLHRAGAKVILTSSWDHNEGSRILSDESAADYLSELLQLRVTAASSICGGIHLQMDGQGSGDILLIQNLKNHTEEFANCSTFARRLSMGVDIFVNDTLSQSHRILASTVGVARFTYASIAGFHFEEELSVLMKAMKPPHRPYIAVVWYKTELDIFALYQFQMFHFLFGRSFGLSSYYLYLGWCGLALHIGCWQSHLPDFLTTIMHILSKNTIS